MRTPLTTIKTFTHVLQHTNPSAPERDEYLETIAVECDLQIDLVTNLLDLSRLESGAYNIELSRVSCAEVITACANLARLASEVRRQTLVIKQPNEPMFVVANKTVLRRILCTLVENAIKYTPEFGEIVLGVAQLDEEIGIYIKDNGRGVSAEDLPHILSDFIGAVDRRRPLSGRRPWIGCRINPALVWASILCRGLLNSLAVTYPWRAKSITAVPSQFTWRSGAKLVKRTRHPNMSKRLLIVDDEPNLLRAVEACLRAEGFEVVTARSGRDALVSIAQTVPDLVVSDIRMPGMNGFELAQHLRASSPHHVGAGRFSYREG